MLRSLLVKEITRKVYESVRIIGAVCHGPVALLNVYLSNGEYLITGKRITAFTEAEEQEKNHTINDIIPFILEKALVAQGAIFVNADPFEPYVVADGNLITGQNPASSILVAREMIKLLIE